MSDNEQNRLNDYVAGLHFSRRTRKSSVIVADSDDLSRDATLQGFSELGWRVRGCASAMTALRLAAEEAPELLVTELRLPDASGLTLLSVIRVNAPAIRVALATAWPSIATAVQAVKWGATDYLVKPVHVEQLVRAINRPPCQCTPSGIPVSHVQSLPEHRPGLRRLQWEHVQRALVEAGSVAGAARLLGVDRRSLRRTLAKYPEPDSHVDGTHR
jgi:two-component system response regulator RegA